ncbi:hypothetical protein [Propionivibrio sp.]|uniref:hypothetical protein n=1 Tax=Propionivibrio sp. TaxID=2212460 RepID=UPI003BF0A645
MTVTFDYFTYEGVPGRYFACVANKANLSELRCATMYRDAKKLPLGACVPLEKCLGCPIGALHAGDKAPQAKERPVGTLICSRCHHPAARIICGGVCVSCYNREREMIKGKNGKGVPPRPVERFWDDEAGDCRVPFTHRVELTFSVLGVVRPVIYRNVADTFEAVLRTVRGRRDTVTFGFHSAVKAPMQMSLWGGM